MKRVLVVYNPRSSRFCDVEREVLAPLRKLKGYMVGKFEVRPTDVDKNAAEFARLLKDGDLVVTAGGDATAAIAANGILLSAVDARLAVLPYGNFNDLARTLGVSNLAEVFGKGNGGVTDKKSGRVTDGTLGRGLDGKGSVDERLGGGVMVQELYPLEVLVDGEFFRYATCYVTIGMTAEAVEIFDHPKVRGRLKSGFGRKVGSYLSLMGWYFRNRGKREFLPEFSLNGVLQRKRTSDYAAVNGRSMARVMKGGEDWKQAEVFRSETERTVKFWPLVKLMMRSIFVRVPGAETRGDVLEFTKAAEVEIQAEGEYRKFRGVRKIEIRKSEKVLKVISLDKKA